MQLKNIVRGQLEETIWTKLKKCISNMA